MSTNHQENKAANGNLVAFIMIMSSWVIGGVILSNSPISPPQTQTPAAHEVVMSAPTATPLPTDTLQPPTATPTVLPTVAQTPLPTATNAVQEPATEQPTGSNVTSSYDPAQVARGQQLFAGCSGCHGPDAHGIAGLGKDLVNSEYVHSLSDEDLLTFLKTGRPIWDTMNTTGVDMPPRGGNPTLTDDDLLAIIAYLRSLTAESDTGG